MALFDRRKTANVVDRLKSASESVRVKTASVVNRLKDSGLDDVVAPIPPIVAGTSMGLLLALTYAVDQEA